MWNLRFLNTQPDQNELINDLSTLQYSVDDENLGGIENQLINKYVPVLNLKDNLGNRYRAEISALRKQCRDLARKVGRGAKGSSKESRWEHNEGDVA